mgnify:CR=1 FL=1
MTMRWDCHAQGCYLKYLPDWGFLDGCFPRKIEPSDIDGCVELNGRLLFLEWKRAGATLKTGQRKMFEAATRHGNIAVFVIFGDPLTNAVKSLQEIHMGKVKNMKPCGNGDLRKRCEKWAQWAEVGT